MDREADCFTYQKPVEFDVRGFISEGLYRQEGSEEPGVIRSVNIGRWNSREHFEANFGVEIPPPEGLEARAR